MRRFHGARALVVLTLFALGLAGCGRRGALEPSPDPAVPAATAAGASLQPMEQRTKRVPITPPHEPFILDPLL